MPEPTDEALDSVLAAADDLFYRDGIAAVTMADIRDQSGVAFRRLYSMFPSKSDVVTGWLARRHQTWMSMLEDGVELRMAEGADPIDAIFGSIEEWLVATDFRGCGFVNALAETGEVTDEHRTLIRFHKQVLREYLSGFTSHADSLAVVVDGAIVQAAVFGSVDPVAAGRLAAAPLVSLSLAKDNS